jgi:archaeal flagellin FlaB
MQKLAMFGQKWKNIGDYYTKNPSSIKMLIGVIGIVILFYGTIATRLGISFLFNSIYIPIDPEMFYLFLLIGNICLLYALFDLEGSKSIFFLQLLYFVIIATFLESDVFYLFLLIGNICLLYAFFGREGKKAIFFPQILYYAIFPTFLGISFLFKINISHEPNMFYLILLIGNIYLLYAFFDWKGNKAIFIIKIIIFSLISIVSIFIFFSFIIFVIFHTGVLSVHNNTSNNLVLSGYVKVDSKNNNEIDIVTFYICNAGGTTVDLNKTVITYTDDNHSISKSYGKGDQGWNYYAIVYEPGHNDNLLESGEKYKILINLSSVNPNIGVIPALGPNEKFKIEVKQSEGAALTIIRTTPLMLVANNSYPLSNEQNS